MRLSSYTIEYRTGKVSMVPSNLLVSDVTDMDALEFWERRLKKLKQPYVVAFQRCDGRVIYSIFTDLRRRESVFG